VAQRPRHVSTAIRAHAPGIVKLLGIISSFREI